MPVRYAGKPSPVRGGGAGEVGPRGDVHGGELNYAREQEQAG